MNYLIVKCEELNQQWECDANRIPICVTDDYSEYNIRGYEIYSINNKGVIDKCIKNYDEDNSLIELIVYRYVENEEEDLENNTDIEIFESIKTNYTDFNIKTRQKIANSSVFPQFVEKYLDTNKKTIREYKNDFIYLGYCDGFECEEDEEEEENRIIISLKQSNRITRNY